MNSVTEQTPARQSLVGQPVSTACELNDWCVKDPGHLFGCSGENVELQATWEPPLAQADTHFILRAQLSHDDEINETKLVFDAGTDDWITYDTGDELRAYVARVRGHLQRLDALADLYDRIIAKDRLQALLAQHKTVLVKVAPGEMPHSGIALLDQIDSPALLFLAEGNTPDVDLMLARALLAEINRKPKEDGQ